VETTGVYRLEVHCVDVVVAACSIFEYVHDAHAACSIFEYVHDAHVYIFSRLRTIRVVDNVLKSSFCNAVV
jgi:hypothetical protein